MTRKLQSLISVLALAAIMLVSTGATGNAARFGRPICTDGPATFQNCPIFPPIG